MRFFRKTKTQEVRRRHTLTKTFTTSWYAEILEVRQLLSWVTVISHGNISDSGRMRPVGEAIEAQYRKIGLTVETRTANINYDTTADAIEASSNSVLNGWSNGENLILYIDWSETTINLLQHGRNLADEVGARVGILVGRLVRQYANVEGVHFIGHSRGGFVVSTAAAVLNNHESDVLAHAGSSLQVVQAYRSQYLTASPGTVNITTLDPQPWTAQLESILRPNVYYVNPFGQSNSDGMLYIHGINRWENFYREETPNDFIGAARFEAQLDDGYPVRNVEIPEELLEEHFGQVFRFGHSQVVDWYARIVGGDRGVLVWNTVFPERIRHELGNVEPILAELRQGPNLVMDPNERMEFVVPNTRKLTDDFLPRGGEVLGVQSPPQVQDDHGDHPTSSTYLVLGSDQSATPIGAIDQNGDVDWFRVVAVNDGPLKVETGVGFFGSNLQNYIGVYNSELVPLAIDRAGSEGASSQLVINVTRGAIFFIRIAGIGTSTGSYHLLVSQPLDGTVPVSDPNDNPPPPRIHHDSAGGDFPGARRIAFDDSNKGDDATRLDAVDDVDFFVFQANATGTIEMDVNPQGSLITNVTLFDAQRDADGDPKPDGVDSDASDSADGISHLIYDVIAGGTYYLRVESKDRDRTGEYDVHIRPFDPDAQPGGSGTDGPPGPLPGWGGVRGVEINLDANGNGASRGGIDDPAEVKWFQIDGTHAGFMEIRVAGVNDDLKPFITAFRADGGGIDTDSGEFDGQAKVAFEVAEGERIIVAVSSANGRTTGTFTLDVLQPATLPDDDLPDFGEQPRDMDPQVTDEGDGSLRARIETPNDDDWVRIPIAGTGFVTIQVDTTGSTLLPFLELSRDGSSGTFFETDDGRDGRAQITFLPDVGQMEVFAKISALDDSRGQYTLNVWRTQNPGDDYPDAGGTFLQRRDLPANGQLFISGRIDGPTDSDNFHFRAEQPGHVAVQVIPLTTGFDPFFSRSRQSSDPNQRTGTSGGGSGRGGRAYEMLDNILAAPDNQIVVDVKAGENSTTPIGEYVVHVRQTQSPNDIDPETIGIEASPILLDGMGNGSLPGTPNNSEPPPALDFAGDVDVFQIVAASDRPLGITVNGTGITGGTFLRIYDANRRPIVGDHNSGPNGESTVTLEANRDDLYYLEIQAFDGASTGTYSITVEQPRDDHPDAPIFVPIESQTNDATPIALDASGFGQATGQIGTNDPNNSLVGDRDIFQVVASERGQITIDVITADNQLDTFLRVYDSLGNLVAIDDDGGDGRNSRVTFNTFMDEIYLIEVSGYADNSIGTYQVNVQTHERAHETFIGVYDDFTSGQISDSRFRNSSTGTGVIEQAGGVVRLQANGDRSGDNNNTATLESRATITGDVEFDFTPSLGSDENSAQIDFTNGTDFIRLLVESDGSGGIMLTVNSSGYTKLTDVGSIALVQGQTYHLKVLQVGGTIAISIDGDAPIATFAGSFKSETALRSQVQTSQRPVYDDFNDNSIDPNRWNTSGDVIEQDGRLHVWMYRDGGLRNSRATTQGKPGGTDIHGFFLGSDRTAGTVGPGQAEAWVGITNGTDYVRFRWLNDINQMIVETSGAYGEGHPAARWDPGEPGTAETPDGSLEIRERNGNIEFLHDGTIQYTLDNRAILPNSWFEVVGFGQQGENGSLNRDYEVVIDNLRLYTGVGRFAELTLDNLAGEFMLPNDPVLRAYDDFNDNEIDFEKWRVTGSFREEDGQLKLPIYRNEQPVSGSISTGGIPGGTNLRGFRVGTNRTANPKVITDRDIVARMELTNGVDSIRVGWTMKRNSFLIETGGDYGQRTLEISVSSDAIPDGRIEVRERDGNIEVLHNGKVEFVIPSQTVRAGSYFTFETDGDPESRGLTLNGIEFYDAIIDNLEFYYDPEPYTFTVTPSLKAESDSGLSDADHITNQLSLQFDWTAGPEGTQYQWREGELLDDGTIAYGDWSDPQSETMAQVNLSGASIHVFSVRPISPEGIVGEESACAVSVDIHPPQVSAFDFIDGSEPWFLIQFDEPIYGTVDDVTIHRESDGSVLQATSITGFGTTTLEILLPETILGGTYIVTLDGTNGLTDVAGNPLDGDENAIPGGDFQQEFVVPLFLNGNFVTGAGPGGSPHVRIFDGSGSPRFDVMAYSPNFFGGVRVATGDVNGDGTPDIITAPGPSGGPNIRVFDGRDGSLLKSFFAYNPNFFSGVYVAAADLNGDQHAEIITAADAGGGPHVRVFDDRDGNELFSFMAYATNFFGGVRVATGDVNGDGTPDIITAPGVGGGPHVRVFDGTSGLPLNGPQHSFMAYHPTFVGGLYVSAANVNGDEVADIITGAGAGGGPHVQVFDGTNGNILQSFMAYSPTFLGGVRVGAADVTGDGLSEIITAPGVGGGPHVRAFDSQDRDVLDLSAYHPSFAGGVYLAGHPQIRGQALRAADDKSHAGEATQPLTAANIESLLTFAQDRLISSGLSLDQINRLHFAELTISDLPGNLLGLTNGQRITLDVTAAGFGWFVDPTSERDEEFLPSPVSQEMLAVNPQGIDLLTVLMHELSHVIGRKDQPANSPTSDLMTETLPVGVRRLPAALDSVFVGNDLMDELLLISL